MCVGVGVQAEQDKALEKVNVVRKTYLLAHRQQSVHSLSTYLWVISRQLMLSVQQIVNLPAR